MLPVGDALRGIAPDAPPSIREELDSVLQACDDVLYAPDAAAGPADLEQRAAAIVAAVAAES